MDNDPLYADLKLTRRRMTAEEAKAACAKAAHRRHMLAAGRRAFSDLAMLENASLVVWTRSQMRGIRAIIRRLGMVGE